MKNLVSFIMLLGVCFIGGIVGQFMTTPPIVQADSTPARYELPQIQLTPNTLSLLVDTKTGELSLEGETYLDKVEVTVTNPKTTEIRYIPIKSEPRVDTLMVEPYPRLKFDPIPPKGVLEMVATPTVDLLLN